MLLLIAYISSVTHVCMFALQKVLNSSNTAEKSAEYALVEFVTGQGLITALCKYHLNYS